MNNKALVTGNKIIFTKTAPSGKISSRYGTKCANGIRKCTREDGRHPVRRWRERGESIGCASLSCVHPSGGLRCTS